VLRLNHVAMFAAVLAASVVCRWGTAYAAQWELAAFAVENFEDAGECCGPTSGSSCGDLTWTYQERDVFLMQFAQAPLSYDDIKFAGNTGVRATRFQDRLRLPDGRDGRDTTAGFGSDFADVVFLSTHGKRDPVGYTWSSVTMGTTAEPCRVQTTGMIFGGGDTTWGSDGTDAEIVILSACQSAQKSVFDNGGYIGVAGPQLTMYAGYHGISFDSNDNVNRMSEFVAHSTTSAIGANWVDDLTDLDFWSSNNDQCATAIVYGSSKSVRNSFYNQGGFRDLFDTGSHLGLSYYYWCGCDPDDGDQLPDC